MIPLVVCTTGGPHLSRLMETVDDYASDQVEVWVFNGTQGNFGDAYNYAMREAFECYDEILIANDDIALTPSSIRKLMDDVKALKRTVPRLGLVASRADNVRDIQKGNPLDQWKPVEANAISPSWPGSAKRLLRLRHSRQSTGTQMMCSARIFAPLGINILSPVHLSFTLGRLPLVTIQSAMLMRRDHGLSKTDPSTHWNGV